MLAVLFGSFAFGVFAGCPAEGALLVYEGFDYAATVTPDTPDNDGDGRPDVRGQTGGIGFTAAWTEMPGDPTEPADYDYIKAPGLVFGSLKTSGNTLHELAPNQVDSAVGRSVSVIPGSEGSVVWVSFLTRKTAFVSGTATNFSLTLFSAARDASLDIGTFADSTNYGLTSSDNFSSESSNVSANNFNTALLVVAVHFSATNQRVDLFVNPTPGQAAPAQANVTLQNFSLSDIGAVQVTASGRPTDEWEFDELRIGQTFADVTPTIPESGSGALLGLSAWLGGVRRREGTGNWKTRDGV